MDDGPILVVLILLHNVYKEALTNYRLVLVVQRVFMVGLRAVLLAHIQVLVDCMVI